MRLGDFAGPRRQGGVTLVLYTTGALAILGAASLALDLGLAYLSKTRLQNAIDAAALAGAYTLHRTFSPDAAREQALETFALNATAFADEDEAIVPTVEMSLTLDPWVPTVGVLPRPNFVKVVYEGLPVPAVLASVVPGLSGALTVSASAVAGGVPVGEICDAVPMAVCGIPGDSDCSDGSCFGLPSGEFEIKNHEMIGPGNYGLVRTGGGRGAAAVRRGMAGGANFCFEAGEKLRTQPGVESGPVAAGLNTRLGLYSQGLTPAEYPPDVVTTNGPGVSYAIYQALLASEATWNQPNGEPQRRVLTVAVIDCTGGVRGSRRVPTLGGVCIFLRREVDNSDGTVYGEVAPTCLAHGGLPAEPQPGGPVRIGLYQVVGGG